MEPRPLFGVSTGRIRAWLLIQVGPGFGSCEAPLGLGMHPTVMRTVLIVFVCLFASENLSGEEAGPLPPEKLEWLYTLAVQKGEANFSFSIMKQGWLSFDTWVEGGDLKEERIELTTEQFDELIVKFTECFVRVKDLGAANDKIDFSYCFEQASDTAIVTKLSGETPGLRGLVDELSDFSGKPLPFALKKKPEAAFQK